MKRKVKGEIVRGVNEQKKRDRAEGSSSSSRCQNPHPTHPNPRSLPPPWPSPIKPNTRSFRHPLRNPLRHAPLRPRPQPQHSPLQRHHQSPFPTTSLPPLILLFLSHEVTRYLPRQPHIRAPPQVRLQPPPLRPRPVRAFPRPPPWLHAPRLRLRRHSRPLCNLRENGRCMQGVRRNA